MFGTMKKAAVIAAVAATGAVVAPSVASANVWQADNPVVKPYAGTAHIGGTLTLTLPSTGATTTCTVTATTNLTNPGGVAAGSITIFRLGAPAGGTCTTNAPNCTVTATAASLPWGITTSGGNVTISGINFTNSYSGVGCSLNGVNLNATGSITGTTTTTSNVITFTNATGLSTPAGPATVSGTVRAYVENSTGGPNTSRPITLVP